MKKSKVIEDYDKVFLCEICGKKMKPIYKRMALNEKTVFLYCSNCKLRWAPNIDFNRSFMSKLNENSRQEALSNIRKHEFEQVNRLVYQFVEKGHRGLEIGCAYGWYLDTICEEYHMEGIEPEDKVAQVARLKGHKVYSGFFPDDIPAEADKYDFLVFNNVWEHINNTSKLIDRSRGLLNEKGLLFITIPLSTGGIYKTAEMLEFLGNTKWLTRLWQLHFHSPHIYYFTKRNFVKLMEKKGFDLLTIENMIDSIDPKKMKERFAMDSDEKSPGIKAFIFRIFYPFIRILPADKAIFVFQYNSLGNSFTEGFDN